MARAAPGYGAEIRFCSIPDRSWPLAMATAARAFRAASERSDAILLDSLAAAFVTPWIARSPAPVIAVLHQPPGGVGHGCIRSLLQGALYRLSYRLVSGLLAAGQSLVHHHHGIWCLG